MKTATQREPQRSETEGDRVPKEWPSEKRRWAEVPRQRLIEI